MVGAPAVYDTKMRLRTSEKQLKNYINGNFYQPISGNYLPNYNPATGEVYSYLPDSGEEEVNQAVKAGQMAFPSWSRMDTEKRFRILLRIADLIEQHMEQFAQAESMDSGKPLSLAASIDIPRAAQNFRFFATASLHFASQAHPMPDGSINYTLRDPIGVVGCISPWNLPLYLFTWKIAPALATGNCVIGKPSELTPQTAFLLSQICDESGLPNGVLNIIHGLGSKVGRSIVAHPEIKAISFTGGTSTGREIASIAAPMFKKLSLELGGKNPVIIFEDCDFGEMIKTTLHSSFRNQGQICLCGSRIFIEKSIYGRFKSAFIGEVSKIKLGDPVLLETEMGAVVSESHLHKILSYIALAKEEGGHILCGGTQENMGGRCVNGWFVSPTVIENLSYNCRTNQEEIFGPVVTLIPFESEEEVLQMANSTGYGLAAVVWTQHLQKAHRMAARLQSGIVWLNCWMKRDLRTPFGGVKNSGVGREGGWEAMQFFTEAKNVCLKI